MRVVADIPHPRLKITVFHMNFKYAVKFETPLYEQWYKFRESEMVSNPRDVIALVDDEMIDSVIKIMGSMHDNNVETFQRISKTKNTNSADL